MLAQQKKQTSLRHQTLRGLSFALATLFLLAIAPAATGQETVFTYRAPESARDQRYNYDTAALRLALEKTRDKYGAYRLEPSPVMTFPQAMSAVTNNTLPNFFIKLSYQEIRVKEENMIFPRFPVDLGIVGYRVCFTNPESKAHLAKVETLDDLRKLSIGQGHGWADVEILRKNGFRVTEMSTYESLFQSVAKRRFDLFCRGANELLDEYEAHSHIPDLSYDETISIAYPLPRFFFTHKSNQKAVQRIEEGLQLAYRDGSLQKAWERNYRRSIDFVKLEKRRIFWVENPLLKRLDFDYRQYFYNPFAGSPPPATSSTTSPP